MKHDNQDVYKSTAYWILQGNNLYEALYDIFHISMYIEYGHHMTSDTKLGNHSNTRHSSEDLHI
ncbi:hypothetical protein HETIRDRAFT_422599 [Heterobasidion irregulare TC 32-1]|uniref:Uncharacterized protein n=1 Tax=Heterobasidion irregulare (strain TC 32-1) TaxID=747525 RepID=W4JR89_HETIT|nr:uncharacterized protein HETIRDRAFT_422599 [Heterobasidion irregulare TC 32-1]ETW75979.1 hypothetical protein HETIRDRAFT_422599 [Heterobasidion irregulare TC 32-1]